MPVPYCVKCKIEMKCIKTGYVLYPADRVDDAHYHTDLFMCIMCGAEAHNTLAGPCYNKSDHCKGKDNG